MEENIFDFEKWTKTIHLTSRTVQILTAEELTILPAILLLEDKDLRELSISLGQRKLLLDGIRSFKSNLNVVVRQDQIAEMFTPAPSFALQKTKSAVFTSFNKKSLSFTTETFRSYRGGSKSKCIEYTCSQMNIQKEKTKPTPRRFNTIMLVQGRNDEDGAFAASLSANGTRGDIFEFRNSNEMSLISQNTHKEIDFKDGYTFKALNKYLRSCELNVDNRCAVDGLCIKDSKEGLLNIQKLTDNMPTSMKQTLKALEIDNTPD